MAIPLIKGKPISGKPLGIIFICIGVGILIIGFPNIKFSKESSHWPTTTGVVVLSEIKEYQSNRTDNFSGIVYGPHILYEYYLDDIKYLSDRYTFSPIRYGNPDNVKKIVDLFNTGEKITVYYNPKNPKISVLKSGTNISSYIIIFFGLVGISIGVTVLLIKIK